MNTTAVTEDAAKVAVTTTQHPTAKPQRRMARPAPAEEGVTPSAATSATSKPAPKTAPGNKISAVIALLERDTGATLAELIAATGWLPHTTRAALTGLRKKGHEIERSKRGEETCYRVALRAPGGVKVG